MFKKFFAVLLVLTVSLSLFSCTNNSGKEKGPLKESVLVASEIDEKTTLTYDVYEDYVIITGSISEFETLVIPETLSGKTVRAIADNAFCDMATLLAVTISDSVTEIGEGAFSGCTSLGNVVLSENLYSLGTSAFFGCVNLPSIRIPLGTEIVGAYSFAECTSLKNIFIPDNTKNIGGGAFWGTLWLENQKDEMVIAGQNILIHYNGSKEEVTVPDGVEKVAAFSENFFTKVVKIPASVTEICPYAFANSSVDSVIMGENVKIIGDNAFDGCLNLNKIRINDKTETIGNFAFTGCQNLKNFTIPKNVRVIGNNVFARCEGLEVLTFTSDKTEIGSDICESCDSLKKIACPRKSPAIDYAKENKINIDIV
ncbi:MAG: leucine-rich repeat domain-containing protein [Clostridia bacterium]|nr:leucine-rich repeat domain-containing protein [Clostridia bacterium]